jgi:hypothetical protein
VRRARASEGAKFEGDPDVRLSRNKQRDRPIEVAANAETDFHILAVARCATVARVLTGEDHNGDVLFVGDSHGNPDWWSVVIAPFIAVTRPKFVISVGDFGYWPSHPEGVEFLEVVSESLRRSGSALVFVDGNHEQHDALGQLDGSPFSAVADRIAYAHRGARWEWSGIRFGALGGAVSPDRHHRAVGWDWFSEERIAATDVDRLGTDPVDVLVTHDAPSAVPLVGLSPNPPSAVVERDAAINRAFVDAAIRATCPTLVVHGHWHVSHSTWIETPHSCTVVGLAADNVRDPAQSTVSLAQFK